MAGNHVHDHVVKRRVLAVLLAGATAWIPADIWRSTHSSRSAPLRVVERGEAYASARHLSSERLAARSPMPVYSWLADQGQREPGYQELAHRWRDESADPLVFDLDAAISPSSLGAGQGLVPESSAATLQGARQGWTENEPFVVELLPRASSPQSRGLLAQSCWQLGQWLAGSDPRDRAAEGARLASPPSLIEGVRVEGDGDRLAMLLPRAARGAMGDAMSERDLSDELWERAQPYLANRLDLASRRSIYPTPVSLVALLQELMLELELTEWASESLGVLAQLTTDDLEQVDSGLLRPHTAALIERLAVLSHRAERLAERASDPGVATQLRRARYAMWRRVQCWYAAGDAITPLAGRFVLASTQTPSGWSNPVGQELQVEQLLETIERFEELGDRQSERQIAQQIATLALSSDQREQALAQSLDLHYRNANLRIALSQEFLNRLMPQGEKRDVPVRDRILGTPVSGVAETVTTGEVQLVPDPSAWRVVLQVRGQAAAKTVARQRSVRVLTMGDTDFVANQQILLDEGGLRVGEARANAQSNSQFVRASSQLDAVPLVGGLVRSKAKGEFFDRRGEANRQVASKTEAQSCHELESKVGEALAKAEAAYLKRIAQPFTAADVALEPIEIVTTPERLVSRLRISREESLAAFTPRPRAPSDSVASLQIHQSALNGLAATLRLDGERLTAEELGKRFAETRQRKGSIVSEVDASQVLIEFAPDEALAVRLAEGRVHLTLSIRELVIRNRSIRDFKIHTYYVPQVDQMQARFQHAEGPYFEGSVRNSQRMALHATFAPVLGTDSGWAIGEALAGDPRMQGLMVTQMVIDDGWIGLAVGPESTERTAQLDRYEWIR